jgi:hypothetical protein
MEDQGNFFIGLYSSMVVIPDAICDGREMFETPVSSFSRLGSGIRNVYALK